MARTARRLATKKKPMGIGGCGIGPLAVASVLAVLVVLNPFQSIQEALLPNYLPKINGIMVQLDASSQFGMLEGAQSATGGNGDAGISTSSIPQQASITGDQVAHDEDQHDEQQTMMDGSGNGASDGSVVQNQTSTNGSETTVTSSPPHLQKTSMKTVDGCTTTAIDPNDLSDVELMFDLSSLGNLKPNEQECCWLDESGTLGKTNAFMRAWLPNLVMIGAQKSATTYVTALLDTHESVHMQYCRTMQYKNVKELHFWGEQGLTAGHVMQYAASFYPVAPITAKCHPECDTLPQDTWNTDLLLGKGHTLPPIGKSGKGQDKVLSEGSGQAEGARLEHGAENTTAVGDDEIVGDEKAGDEIAGDKIAGDEIAGDEIAGDEIAGDEIAGDKIAGDEIVGDEIAGDEIAGDEIAGDEIAGDEIAGDEIAGDKIAGDEIAGDEIAGDVVLAGAEPSGDAPVGQYSEEDQQVGDSSQTMDSNSQTEGSTSLSTQAPQPSAVSTSTNVNQAIDNSEGNKQRQLLDQPDVNGIGVLGTAKSGTAIPGNDTTSKEANPPTRTPVPQANPDVYRMANATMECASNCTAAHPLGGIRIDATPAYMARPYTACRIAAFMPKVKILVLLRDPVQRALSQYKMNYHNQRDTPELLSNLVQDEWNVMSNIGCTFQPTTSASASKKSWFQCYGCHSEDEGGRFCWSHVGADYEDEDRALRAGLVARGMYAPQIAPYLQYFDASQLLLINFDQVLHDEFGVARKITQWMGISATFQESNKYNSKGVLKAAFFGTEGDREMDEHVKKDMEDTIPRLESIYAPLNLQLYAMVERLGIEFQRFNNTYDYAQQADC